MKPPNAERLLSSSLNAAKHRSTLKQTIDSVATELLLSLVKTGRTDGVFRSHTSRRWSRTAAPAKKRASQMQMVRVAVDGER